MYRYVKDENSEHFEGLLKASQDTRSIFLYSDLHIKESFGNMNYLDVLTKFKEAVPRHQMNYCLGDFFDTSRPSSAEIEMAHKFIARQNLFILGGNHTKKKDGDKDILDVVLDISGCNSRSDSLTPGMVNFIGDDVKVLLVNLGFTKELYQDGFIKSYIQRVKDQTTIDYNYTVLMIHGAFSNCMSGAGILLDSGIELKEGDLDGVDLVLAGDYHRHQAIPNPDNVPAYYIGSPFRTSFGDRFEGHVGYLCAENGELVYYSFKTTLLEKIFDLQKYYELRFGIPKVQYLTFSSEIENDGKVKDRYFVPLEWIVPFKVEDYNESDQVFIRVIYDRDNELDVSLYQKLIEKTKDNSNIRVYDNSFSGSKGIGKTSLNGGAQDIIDSLRSQTKSDWKNNFKKHCVSGLNKPTAKTISELIEDLV